MILPQALKLVIPGLVTRSFALFKDTSLVIIIGLFDLFSSVQQATVDPVCLGMSTEGYVFAALIYWIFVLACRVQPASGSALHQAYTALRKL